LRGEEFLLKSNNRPVTGDGIMDVLESLRHIKRGLDGAEPCKYFFGHIFPSNAESGEPSSLTGRPQLIPNMAASPIDAGVVFTAK
jgi:hypothetical protein